MRRRDHDALRIALLAPCFWPEVRRGAERFVRELADELVGGGHRPTLITSHPRAPSLRHEEGLRVLRLPRPPQGRLIRRGYEPYLTHVPLSYIALRLGSFDLVHAVHPPDALAGARWKARTGGPVILSYMGVPDRAGLRERRRRLEILQRALEACDAVVALSRYAAEAFEYWLGYRARVIAPGVNTAAFRPGGTRTPNPTILCSAAADVPRKNVGLLVRALQLVRAERPETELILSRPRDMHAVARAGVDLQAQGVRWMNLDDREALAAWNAASWVAALPARDEAFGLVLAEALACGTPVVGYAQGGIPEVVDRPQIGRLFDRLEPRPLADALLQALDLSTQPPTAAACRARALELSSENTARAYMNLYGELLGSRARAVEAAGAR